MRIDFSLVPIAASASITPSDVQSHSKFQSTYSNFDFVILSFVSQHGVLQKCFEIIILLNFFYATNKYENKHER